MFSTVNNLIFLRILQNQFSLSILGTWSVRESEANQLSMLNTSKQLSLPLHQCDHTDQNACIPNRTLYTDNSTEAFWNEFFVFVVAMDSTVLVFMFC